MRYYRYGQNNRKQEAEVNRQEKNSQTMEAQFGKLIIDEDSVYEIDEECLRCKKKE